MTEPSQHQTKYARRTTGVPGLDDVLHGGVIPAAVYIVQGSPGAGKTILANQICFHRATQGEQCLYVTLLAESHDRMMEHLAPLGFFDKNQVPTRSTTRAPSGRWRRAAWTASCGSSAANAKHATLR